MTLATHPLDFEDWTTADLKSALATWTDEREAYNKIHSEERCNLMIRKIRRVLREREYR